AALDDGTAPADELLCAVGLDPVEGRSGPVEVEGVTGVEGGLRLDQVPGEQDAVAGEPRHEVALGVPTPRVVQDEVAAVPAEVDRHGPAEGDGRPGDPGDGVGVLEQAGHATELGLPVLPPALGDEVP